MSLSPRRPSWTTLAAATTWVVLAAWTATTLLTSWLPFVDVPQHAQTLTMLRHPEVYSADYRVQLVPWATNSPWFVLDGLLAWFVSPEVSLALAAVLAVVALPLALAGWARAQGRSGAVAATLGWWLAWSKTLYWGFLHFTLSLAAGVGVLALDLVELRRPPGKRAAPGIALGAALIGLYLLHAQSWLFVIGALVVQRTAWSALAVPGEGDRWRRVGAAWLRLAGWALPSAALFASWALGTLVFADAEQTALATLDQVEPRFQSLSRAFDAFFRNANAVVRGTDVDDALGWILLGLAVAALALAGVRLWRRRDRGEAATAATALGIGLAGLATYLFVPLHIRGQFYLSSRMAVWALIPAVPLAAASLGPRWRAAGLTLATAGAFVSVSLNTAAIGRFDAEVRPAIAMLDRIEPGQRVVQLAESRRSSAVPDLAYTHLTSWYASRHLGRTHFSFAEFAPNPVVYRDRDHLPRSLPGEEFRPWCTLFVGDGGELDYVVTRGGSDPDAMCGVLGRYADQLTEIDRAGDWAVYRVTSPLGPKAAVGCGCARRAPHRR